MTGGQVEGGSKGKVMAPPPDGGWGWPVTIASFLIHFILDGISYSIGVFVVGLIEYFEASRAEAGWVGSIMMGVTYSAGPVASVLCSRFGCRTVTVTGALIGASGLILSIFCTSIRLMYVTFGIITGFGLGMTYLPAIVCVAYYFEQKRSLAIGIACCGSGVGTLVFGVFAGYLLDNYGWKGGMLIEAGLVLNCCALGLIFVEPTLPADKRPVPMSGGDEAKEDAEQHGGGVVAMDTLQPLQHDGNEHALQQVTSSSVHSNKQRSEETLPMVEAEPGIKEEEEEEKGGAMMDNKSLSRSVLNLPNYRSNPDLYSTSNEQATPAATSSAPSKTGLAAVQAAVRSLMDFSLLCDKLFLLFAISNFFTSVGYLVPYIFLPDRAVEMGLTTEQGALLITVLGGANTFGRVVFGFLSDFLSTNVYLNRTVLYCTSLTIVGLLTMASILCVDFWSLALYSASFGFLMGVYVLLTSVVLVDLLSVERLSNSFGLVLLFQGIASLIGPPIAGAMYDATGEYDVPFGVNGLLIAVSGTMIYAYYCMAAYRRRCHVVADEARKKQAEKLEQARAGGAKLCCS